MPGTNLLTLIDDIATLLDDIAVMTKVATKKTAGVLGDDLALNAQQVSGVNPDRELPVVWAVAKGSFKNKMILVPAALAISALAPWLITPLLMSGGVFLCYEGFEKLAHKKGKNDRLVQALNDPRVDMVTYESEKIRGAIRTDFILSAEIIIITLGSVAAKSLWIQVAVMALITILMTTGVYGLVAGIVKLDDAGLYFNRKSGESLSLNFQRQFGRFLLQATPYLMKGLSIAGTAAMFTVGGSILAHGFNLTHLNIFLEAIIGIITGGISLALITLWKKIRKTD